MFDKVLWTLSDGTVVNCVLDTSPSNLWKGPDKNWWCRVAPKGVSVTGGPRSVNRDSMLIEVARYMYETLRKCSGFRFALVGWEVAESIEIAELLQEPASSRVVPSGLVVSQDLWRQMGRPADLVSFGVETFWKPLEERDFFTVVKLFHD